MAAKKKAAKTSAPKKAAAKPATKAKAKPVAKVKAKTTVSAKAKDEQNGIPRPADVTKGVGRVWAIADEISRKTKKPASRSAVLERTATEGIPDSTASTQYGRWRKYNGLTGRIAA